MKLKPLIEAIANKTRLKLGIKGLINPQDLPNKIGAIRTTADGSLTTYSGSNVVIPSVSGTTLSTNDKYMGTDIYIRGDRNFIAENIKKDVTIWGITGTHEGGYPYAPLAYLQTSGSNYIDTNFKPNPKTTKLIIDLEFTNIQNISSFRALFGQQKYPTSSEDTILFIYQQNLRLDWANYIIYYKEKLKNNFKYSIECYDDNVKINGENYKGNQSKANKYMSSSLIIGRGRNSSDAVSFVSFPFKIYKIQIYDNGKLVRDMIPAQVGNDKGMWDKLENKFYSLI